MATSTGWNHRFTRSRKSATSAIPSPRQKRDRIPLRPSASDRRQSIGGISGRYAKEQRWLESVADHSPLTSGPFLLPITRKSI